MFGHNLNVDDGRGNLVPAQAELWQTSSDAWEKKGGPLSVRLPKTAKGHDAEHEYAGRDGARRTFALSFPALTYRGTGGFGFSLGGETWRLDLDDARTDFSAVVTARRGARTFDFAYDAKGANVSVNAQGNAGDDGLSISRAR